MIKRHSRVRIGGGRCHQRIPQSIINPHSNINKVVINRRPINVDVFVTITARVLVDETKGVAEEMGDYTDLQYTGYGN